MNKKFLSHTKPLLKSYGVLAFSAHPIPSVILFLATCYYPLVGLMGLLGNIISNFMAKWLHANQEAWKAGIFGVSGILIGLALGMYAEPNLRTFIFLIIGAGLSGIVSVMLANFLAKYDLPILSLPFMMVIWLILLTIGSHNETTYEYGAITIFSDIDKWLFNILPFEIFEYVKMFGSILFQDNLISGVLVITAVALYSRISILYGLWGGFIGMIVYTFFNSSLDGFHGLNFVLISFAFGGFFIVGNRHGFALVTLAVIAVGLVDKSMTTLLSPINLPPLVFAFNAVTILFLFPLKMLPWSISPLRLIPIPLYIIKSPESNFRWYRRWSGQKVFQRTILTYPFLGEWTVLQGNNGEWTHKGIGRYAWDFVVRDDNGYQSKGHSLDLSDYFAYNLLVVSPAPGTIYSVENSVVDNPPQTANTERNWGNFVIIDHGNGEFSELSHFKQGSICVVPGQFVNRGDVIGRCGNSGRSPVPHIHYQLQATPGTGAPSLPATFAEGRVNGKTTINGVPQKDDRVSSLDIESEFTWGLTGRETEKWIYKIKIGMRNSSETLTFTTDEYGFPAITSKNNFLWRIIDLPNFVIIRPDYKTFPSILTLSAWIKIVGEQLILPKTLSDGLTWENGLVKKSIEGWKIQIEGKTFELSENSILKKITLDNDSGFQFELADQIIQSK